MRYGFLLLLILLPANEADAGDARKLFAKGWQELIKDNDVEALKYFGSAYETAKNENDTEAVALSLLYLGIGQYSVSYSIGLEYSFKAMAEYKKLERSHPRLALQGRCRCLQLISTIYGRQEKYRESIALSKEALEGFKYGDDTMGYPGLIYSSLGRSYDQLHISDSADYYHRLALEEHLKKNNPVYLPTAYLNMADILMKIGDKEKSREFFDTSFAIADRTGNRQSVVSALLGLGKWQLTFGDDLSKSELYYLEAKKTASTLTDRSFYIRVLEHLRDLSKLQGDFRKALENEEEILFIKDTLNSWEKQKVVKMLEIQFEVAEKERQLKLVQKEKDIANLTNYLLWGTIGFILLIATVIILFLKRIHKRDRMLLQTKEALVTAIEEQKRLKERQMQHDLEFKESQLTAMTFQMVQKNELMQELKEGIEKGVETGKDKTLSKIINKGLNHDKEWSDFNSHFESINKNFYTRLKQAYPDISPNDLKICALIKLRLSIKEMAGILNISPDSVKTARYRLRKKLQLNTEDNLTDFILKLE